MRTISMAREACQWHVLNRLCRGRSGLLFESVIAPGDLSVLREKGSGLRTPSGSRGAVLSSLLAHFRAWLPATPTWATRSLSRRDRATAHGWIFGQASGVVANSALSLQRHTKCEARFLVRTGGPMPSIKERYFTPWLQNPGFPI